MLEVTFKENCLEIQNTKVGEIISYFTGEYTHYIIIFDPWANPDVVKSEYGIGIVSQLPACKYDSVIHCVAHKQFFYLDIRDLIKDGGVVYDVKGILPRDTIDVRL